MNKATLELIIVQFKEFFREPGILFWSFLFPILMALGLGFAFSEKPIKYKTVAYVEANTSDVHEFKGYMDKNGVKRSAQNTYEFDFGSEKTGFTKYKVCVVSWEQAVKMLKQGKVDLIMDEKEGKIQYNYDPLNSEAQLTYLQLTGFFSGNQIKTQEVQIKPLTQKGTRYIDFLIPGLLAMNLMMSTMWGISYNLIEKRSRKLLRRLIATPMKQSDFLIAQLIARFALSFIEAVILFTFAKLFFQIPVEGSLFTAIVIFTAGMICFTGLAILSSCRVSNTNVGNGIVNLVVMPMMIMSGIFFSYHGFPDFMIPIIQKLPLTMIADSIRGVFIEGSTLQELLSPILILTSSGIIFLAIGLKLFKWY